MAPTIDELLEQRRAFGAMLCGLRTAIGLTQYHLAPRVPTTRNRLTRIERGFSVILPKEADHLITQLLDEIEQALRAAVPVPARVPAGMMTSAARRKPIRMPFEDTDLDAVAATNGTRRRTRR